MTSRTVPVPVLLAVLPLLFLLAGCSPTLVNTTPLLPPGFLDPHVPPGDLSAYLYVSQESPLTVPLQKFGDLTHIQGNPGYSEIPETLSLNRLVLAVGPDLDSFSGAIQFNRHILAEMAEDVMSGRPEVSVWRQGNVLGLVRGTGGWADAMENAMRAGDASRFQDVYPDIWQLMQLLPEKPPAKPVAAGFIHVDQVLLDSLAAKAKLELRGLTQALGLIQITDIAYVAYTDMPVALPREVTSDYFEEANVGAIFVARSGYPGFLLSFFLGSFADRVGLEKGSLVAGQKVLSRELGNMYLVVKPMGNTLFLVLAPSRESAEDLMSSVLEPQQSG